MMRRISWMTGLLTALLGSATAAAQAVPLASLEGEVIDSLSQRPAAGVLVRLDSGGETVSDREGRFRLEGLEPGAHVVAALTTDCRVAWTQVTLRPSATAHARLALPGRADSHPAPTAEARARPNRYRVTSAEIDAMHVLSLEDVVRRVAPNLFPRGRNSMVSPAAAVVVVVDGVRAADGARVLEVLRPSDVAVLEVRPGASGGWEFGSSGSAGVIHITTGPDTRGAPSPDRCVVRGFPPG